MEIPTCGEFKKLTGRTGLTKIIKKKQDLDPIYDALQKLESYRMVYTVAALPFLRAVRKVCVNWLSNNSKGKKRASWAPVKDLLEQVDARYLQIVESVYRGTKPDVSQEEAKNARPDKPTNSRAPFIGKQIKDTLARERALPEHWGPHVLQSMDARYKTAKSPLSMREWGHYVYLPAMEDDPSGVFLKYADNKDVRQGFQGVKYCTPDERKSYLIDFENGGLYDQDSDFFDTVNNETEFSGFGWAIFVLGFDNQLYAASHVKNRFHHSSFFAGDAVQCGGEISVDLGKIRFLTAKTGHYQSDTWDFYRLLHFLYYNGVNLSEVLACPVPHEDKNFYNAQQVFENSGKSKGLKHVRSAPVRLSNPGIPR
jgi:hypothetical protein